MAKTTFRAAVHAAHTPRSEPRLTPRPPVTGPGDAPVREAYTDPDAPAHVNASSGSRRRVQIPDLYCPFDPALHPAAAEVHTQSVAWARAMGLARGDLHVQALLNPIMCR